MVVQSQGFFLHDVMSVIKPDKYFWGWEDFSGIKENMQILEENTNWKQFLSICLERDAKLALSSLDPCSAN